MLSPRELWRYRDLAFQIAARDVTVRYRQTALGAAWAVLQPVGFMVVFSLFFGRVAGVSSDGLPYALFSLAALVPWTFFANALLLGSESLVSNSALVSKIYFPRIFMPAGASPPASSTSASRWSSSSWSSSSTASIPPRGGARSCRC